MGVLLPDSDWSPFCHLWKSERDGKNLLLRDKLCFIVVVGKVSACISSSKSSENTEESTIGHEFKRGEVIHLFSNQDKIPEDGDGTSMVFGNLKLTFTPGKHTAVISLGSAEYKDFIDDRPRLSCLAALMKLKMSELVANHIYFEGVSPNKVGSFYYMI